MARPARLVDYLFLLRPLILIPVWDFLLIGAYLAGQSRTITGDIVLGLLIYTMVMGGVYILNQIADVETDRLNQKLFLISGGIISLSSARRFLIGLWLAAVILSYSFGTTFLLFIGISFLLGILYSVPPVKLKGKPILDTLANAFGYGLVNFCVGWLLIRPLDRSAGQIFLPYLLSIAAVFVNTTLADLAGDRQAGEITTAVWLKEPGALIVSTLLAAAAVATAYLNRDLVCLLPAALSFPLFPVAAVYYFLKKTISRKLVIASFRLPGLLFTLVTAYLYWPYLIFLVFVMLGMRIYYKKYFGLNYPTLAGG